MFDGRRLLTDHTVKTFLLLRLKKGKRRDGEKRRKEVKYKIFFCHFLKNIFKINYELDRNAKKSYEFINKTECHQSNIKNLSREVYFFHKIKKNLNVSKNFSNIYLDKDKNSLSH